VSATAGLADRPDPENPGWFIWDIRDPTRFNGQVFGQLRVRRDEDGRGRLRMFPERRNTNLNDNIHGGALLALADVALFAAAYLQGRAGAGGAVTLDLNMQFLGPGRAGIVCDAVGEVLKETGRLVFGRGVIEQGGLTIAAYSGTLRKLSGRSSSGGD
jgi:uncharacterized protein (TIGR00369 family)